MAKGKAARASPRIRATARHDIDASTEASLLSFYGRLGKVEEYVHGVRPAFHPGPGLVVSARRGAAAEPAAVLLAAPLDGTTALLSAPVHDARLAGDAALFASLLATALDALRDAGMAHVGVLVDPEDAPLQASLREAGFSPSRAKAQARVLYRAPVAKVAQALGLRSAASPTGRASVRLANLHAHLFLSGLRHPPGAWRSPKGPRVNPRGSEPGHPPDPAPEPSDPHPPSEPGTPPSPDERRRRGAKRPAKRPAKAWGGKRPRPRTNPRADEPAGTPPDPKDPPAPSDPRDGGHPPSEPGPGPKERGGRGGKRPAKAGGGKRPRPRTNPRADEPAGTPPDPKDPPAPSDPRDGGHPPSEPGPGPKKRGGKGRGAKGRGKKRPGKGPRNIR